MKIGFNVEMEEGEVKAITKTVRIRLREPGKRADAVQAMMESLVPVLAPLMARRAPVVPSSGIPSGARVSYGDGFPDPDSVPVDPGASLARAVEQLERVIDELAPEMVEEAMEAGRGFTFLMSLSPLVLEGMRSHLAVLNGNLQERGYQAGIDESGPVPTVYVEWGPDPASPPGSVHGRTIPTGEA